MLRPVRREDCEDRSSTVGFSAGALNLVVKSLAVRIPPEILECEQACFAIVGLSDRWYRQLTLRWLFCYNQSLRWAAKSHLVFSLVDRTGKLN